MLLALEGGQAFLGVTKLCWNPTHLVRFMVFQALKKWTSVSSPRNASLVMMHEAERWFDSSGHKTTNNEDVVEHDSPSRDVGTASDPKSAIDVAIELIKQAEIEAIRAARIAALNKPKPRGRPPLARKAADSTQSNFWQLHGFSRNVSYWPLKCL